MKYHKSYILVLAVVFSGMAAAQTSGSEELWFVPQEKLTYLSEHQPEQLATLRYMNRHGYHLAKAEAATLPGAYPDILAVAPLYDGIPPVSEALIHTGELNLMAYDVTIREHEPVTYRVGESGRLLVIMPVELARSRKDHSKEN
jgi:hypothetical protein